MKTKNDVPLAPRAADSAFALLLLLWFALPIAVPGIGFQGPAGMVGLIAKGGSLWVFLTAAAWLVPLLALWKIAAFFLVEKLPAFADPDRAPALGLTFIESLAPLLFLLFLALTEARSLDYFLGVPAFTWLVFAAAVVANSISSYQLIKSLRKRDPSWKDWEAWHNEAGERVGFVRRVTRQGIGKTLLLSFVPLILAIILILSWVLMRDFSATILSSVIESGKALADRTANVIKSNPADRIAAEDYLLLEGKKNEASTFHFDVMSYFIKNPKTGAFSVAASTDPKAKGKPAPGKPEAFEAAVYRYDAAREIYEFLAPVTLAKTFIGYVQIDYRRDVIFESYDRTVVKVTVIAALFVYISFFLIYAMGNGIVFPILLLRFSVARSAATLQSMLRGKTKVSAELLTYTDRVRTKDEVKELSGEIGNMTGVIRGIVPYISAETFKHSESDQPTTRKVERCFLFTDIRGFTTMSEKFPPERVVSLLNHYLDIQATVIEANEGDIDKYVGDEVMAVFDGPEKERNACAAALQIKAAMAAEKELALAAKENIVSIGIGINSGEVVSGSVGAKSRMDFTSIGDAVNLAARLEGQNKEYGTKGLITKSVWDKAGEIYLCREVDLIAVKGKIQPVRIYEILQARDKASQKLVDLARTFEEGLALYREKRWDKAEKIFKGLVETLADATSATFLERIAAFRRVPPPEPWDGVFTATAK